MFGFQCSYNRWRDFILNGKDIFQLRIIGFRPEMVTIVEVNQLGTYTELITWFPGTPFKNGLHIQLLSVILHNLVAKLLIILMWSLMLQMILPLMISDSFFLSFTSKLYLLFTLWLRILVGWIFSPPKQKIMKTRLLFSFTLLICVQITALSQPCLPEGITFFYAGWYR